MSESDKCRCWMCDSHEVTRAIEAKYKGTEQEEDIAALVAEVHRWVYAHEESSTEAGRRAGIINGTWPGADEAIARARKEHAEYAATRDADKSV